MLFFASVFFFFCFVSNKNDNNTDCCAKIKRIKLTDNDGWHQIGRLINSRIYEIFLLRQSREKKASRKRRRGDNMSDYLVPGSIRLDCRLIGERAREGGGKKWTFPICQSIAENRKRKAKAYDRCRMSRHA